MIGWDKVTTIVVVGQLIISTIRYLTLPRLEEWEKKTGEFETFWFVVYHSPVLLLIWVDDSASPYLLGIVILFYVLILEKTTPVLSGVINFLINLLYFSSKSAYIIIETLAALQLMVLIRFLKIKASVKAAKQAVTLYILNAITYIIITLSLIFSSNNNNNEHPSNLQKATSTILSMYVVLKFGNIIVGYLKQVMYELLPTETVAVISTILIAIIPTTISVIIATGLTSNAGPVLLILTNVLTIGYILKIKTLRSLILYSTILANIMTLVLYIS